MLVLTFDHDYLLHLRDRTGLSQAHLARALDLSPTLLHNWERGKNAPSGGHLVKLAEYFGLHPRDFFEEESINWGGDV
ncbi:helix-turn-helix domain-containing protein [Streptomyces sp. G1]|uniref:helix-turn-helix domain-containing protein n=1 Tax=Streptomyces sp. G1 TaxID=361572 RepID=UPI0035ABCBD8